MLEKMNWKEFFKFDWRKIILPILFSLIPVIIQIIFYLNNCYETIDPVMYISKHCLESVLLSSLNVYLLISWSLGFPALAISMPFTIFPDVLVIPIWTAISIIYWYFISSLIFYVYEKYRGKK